MFRSVSRLVRKFRAINAHYNTPRIGMSPAVRASLMVLRGYLLFLVALMLYKFVSLLG
ncbi:conserved hypothetical protein [Burkholderiales bacterium]|jgi:hypothetical protein|nr:conserved hypothetical protein [Burkholderiales bacterium]